MTGKFNNFAEVITLLNENNINYIILRNFDNLLTPELFITGHGDIDILCDNPIILANLLGATHNSKDIKDQTHYTIYIYNKPVSLDLRHIGDGYYCTEWEINMLKERQLHSDGFYVPSIKNLFYSLIYHAIFQKRSIGNDYISLLKSYAKKLSIDLDENNLVRSLISYLEKFLQKNNYYYCYAIDKTVPLNKNYIINKNLLQNNFRLKWKHLKFDSYINLIEFAVKIKHLFTQGKFKY